MNNPKKLPFLKALLYAGGFVLLIAVIIAALFQYDASRKDEVYRRYADETNAYISENRAGINKLFNDMFPSGNCINNYYNNNYLYPVASNSSTISNPCAFPNASAIGNTLPQTLKDWSSTMFLKLDGSRVLSMDLSGNTQEFYSYPEEKRTKIIKLLKGEVEKIPWDDYSYTFQRKEVIIPVKDESGKIIGAIVRGVIE